MKLPAVATFLAVLVSASLFGCVCSYRPENAAVIRKGRHSFNWSVTLYKTPEGYVVVDTRQLVDPGNGVCRVNDQRGIDRAATFYSRLLQTPGERISPGRHYFDCGGTILACYDPEADGDGGLGSWRPHPNQYVYFAVSDLDAAYQRAQELGCKIVEGGIQRMPWGERMFWAVDPFANPISFVDENTVFTGSRPSKGGPGA